MPLTGVPPLARRILRRRGIGDAEAPSFLFPGEVLPLPLPGLAAAAGVVREALAAGRPVHVFGDYDVDGLAGATLLAEAIAALGGRAAITIPNRLRDGYGLTRQAVVAAKEAGALLVTVDVGIAAVAEAEEARRLGVPLVVTDHHEPGPVLPPAAAVVNPRLAPEAPAISGAAVAWHLASALIGAPWPGGLALAALATVADQVSVRGWNRSLLRHGLRWDAWAERPGIRALAERLGLPPGRRLSSRQILFQIAPRLNAAGRLGQAEVALALLAADAATAPAIADRLEALNALRRTVQDAMVAEALRLAEAAPPEGVLFVVAEASPTWQRGLLGLVAARLAETTGRAAVVAVRQGDRVHASARAPGEADLLTALEPLRGVVDHLGGHRRALGFSFGRAAEAIVAAALADVRLAVTAAEPAPETFLARADLADVAETVALLEPFGPDFPEPRLLVPHVHPDEVRPLGGGCAVALNVAGVPLVAWEGIGSEAPLRLVVRTDEDRVGGMRLTVESASPSPWRERLLAAGEEAPFPWAAEEEGAPSPLPYVEHLEGAVVVVPSLLLLEWLAEERGLEPLHGRLSAEEVAAAVAAWRQGAVAGFVAYRPPPTLAGLPLTALPPLNAAQIAAFRGSGAGPLRVSRAPVDDLGSLADVERLREVVRRLRRREPVREAVVLGFARKVFAELALDPLDPQAKADLGRSPHFRSWLRHEENRRLRMAAHDLAQRRAER